jgi:endonuclease IV
MENIMKNIMKKKLNIITLFHLNDSKYEPKGVDRHEIIGKGKIDINILKTIVNDIKNNIKNNIKTNAKNNIKNDLK